MKNIVLSAFAFAAFTAVVGVSAANALVCPCDYTGVTTYHSSTHRYTNTTEMGNIVKNQFGTINAPIFTGLFSSPSLTVKGLVEGSLQSHTKVVFNYFFTDVGVADGELTSAIKYDYASGGHLYHGSAYGDSFGDQTPTGTVDGVASTPLVLATAHLNVSPVAGATTGSIVIANLTNEFQHFQDIFLGDLFSRLRGAKGSYITYNVVSTVPLPAALPMFAAVLAGLFGFARFNRKRNVASLAA